MDEQVINRKLQIIEQSRVVHRAALPDWQVRQAQYHDSGEYEYLDSWQPVEFPSYWQALRTIFLRTIVDIPARFDPHHSYLVFSFDEMEGLLRVDDEAWAGLDSNHQWIPAPASGQHEISAEFISVPDARHITGLSRHFGRFSGAELVLLNAELDATYWDVRFAFEACNAITDSRRKEMLGRALQQSLRAINPSASGDELTEQIIEARRILADHLGRIKSDPEAGRTFLTGHTHIDVAWLWPLAETVRKCGRTYATACRMMEKYPNFHFSCSQAQLYQYTKQHFPEIYEQIKHWVGQGRWETSGAMWVEPDTNITSGESLIRQILHGLDFFQTEFGTRPQICWLPDVFGYNAQLPQILKGCGLHSFWTWKLYWQSRNEFPYHLFWWEGIDGSRILAHIPRLPGAYNGNPTPVQLLQAWDNYNQKADYPDQLFPFGYGDGGGGVNRQMLEFAERAQSFPGLPQCQQGTAEQFFEQVRRDMPEQLPMWVGELYLETHRGTYTTQGHTKRLNRQCEIMLGEAELWGVIAAATEPDDERHGSLRDITERLRPAWRKLLCQQFHDILPGSSIGEVYEQTETDFADVLGAAQIVRDRALADVTEEAGSEQVYRIFNSLSWPRDDVVILTVPEVTSPLVAVGDDGQQLPTQVLTHGSDDVRVAVSVKAVPSVGATTIRIQEGQSPQTELQVSSKRLENDFYTIQLDEDGSIISLYDKQRERELVPTDCRANGLKLFQDEPGPSSAWDISRESFDREYQWEDCSLQVVEQGPVRGVIRRTMSYRQSQLIQNIILYAGLPRIDFHTLVDWHQKHTLLKAAFPLNVRSTAATFEIQFGAWQRPTHRNTSWDQEKYEVCGQRWADLSESGYGVSILNDCKYGYDVLGNVLRITLLRGTDYPDPNADQGSHEFTYSLLPHNGHWSEGGTVEQAAQLNVPLRAVVAEEMSEPVSYLSIAGPAILAALKPAEDGRGVIARCYEPYGSRGTVTIRHRLPFSEVIACNLVEEDEGPISSSGTEFSFPISPFEIKTFRLT